LPAEELRESREALTDQLRVVDRLRLVRHDPGSHDLVIGKRDILSDTSFVLVPRV
jgi:hypothetical protein